MKIITRFLMSVVFLAAIPSVSMATVVLSIGQNSLSEELIGVIGIEYSDCSDGIPNCDTVQFTVTNNTDTDWTDYHVRIDRAPTGAAVNPFFNFNYDSAFSDADLASFSHTVENLADLVFIESDPLLTGESFRFNFVYADDDNMAGHIFYGTPTYEDDNGQVPEPSVIALMGLGLLGFVATRRRKIQA